VRRKLLVSDATAAGAELFSCVVTAVAIAFSVAGGADSSGVSTAFAGGAFRGRGEELRGNPAFSHCGYFRDIDKAVFAFSFIGHDLSLVENEGSVISDALASGNCGSPWIVCARTFAHVHVISRNAVVCLCACSHRAQRKAEGEQ